MGYFVKEGENFREIYLSKELTPTKLSFLSSELALKILKELSKEPLCAMDIARRLGEHEQKIYYYIRKFEEVGIIRVVRKEERVGAIAKVYTIDTPYISVKLFDSKPLIDLNIRTEELEFLSPFVEKGKLNSLIVVGSPDPHGRFAAQASDGYAAIDLALFLGSFVRVPTMNYKLDTQVRESDLEKNLILVGGPKTNIWVDKINRKLPVFFDEKNEWAIVSTLSKTVYTDDEIGLIVKMPSPFSKNKWILIASGRRFKGTRAAIIGIVRYSSKLSQGNKYENGIARVVRGIDRDADGIIDDIEIVE